MTEKATPRPHFNDGKNGKFWLYREFIVDSRGGLVLFLILFYSRLDALFRDS